MGEFPLKPLDGRFWRMVRVPHQHEALSGEGARRLGGRWNPIGTPTLYLAQDHATALSEYLQGFPRPGTLIPVDVAAEAVADLTGQDPAVAEGLAADWISIARADGGEPPSWALARRLIVAGAQGALVPSVQNPGGVNLVLWRWGGEGASVRLLDPEGDLAWRGGSG